MCKPGFGKIAYLIMLLLIANAVAGAQTFTNLLSFTGDGGVEPGAAPLGSLTQGNDGNFYATTSRDGPNFATKGTVFKITPTGTLKTLYVFCSLTNCADGAYPATPLVLARGGNFYGTTQGGGNTQCTTIPGCGTVFVVTPAGGLKTLYSFCSQANCTDGYFPQALVLGANGNLYGTTRYGGDNATICVNVGTGCGVFFEITKQGKFTVLHTFCSLQNCADGGFPALGLVRGSDGNFYGLTDYGAKYSDGTAYRISPTGSYKILHNFHPNDRGINIFPVPLIEGTDGNFYGETSSGGSYADGSVFKLTSTGEFTNIYSFSCTPTNCADGAGPTLLIQGSDGNFYGGTGGGGANDFGTIFQLTPDGTLTTLYNICSQQFCADGSSISGNMQATNGILYGTFSGGGYQWGTVFSLSTGLAPFVEPNPPFAAVGGAIEILGNNLTGATGVTFNRTTAMFTVESATYIKATVPTGATTGTIQVTTPSGTLNSNVPFQILP